MEHHPVDIFCKNQDYRRLWLVQQRVLDVITKHTSQVAAGKIEISTYNSRSV